MCINNSVIFQVTIFFQERWQYIISQVWHQPVQNVCASASVDCFTVLIQWHRLLHQPYIMSTSYGPRHDETCLGVFWKSKAQTSLLSYTDYLETWNFACSKPRYDIFQKANNKGADQTARMGRLVCAFVVRKPPKTSFVAWGPYYVNLW